jgi:hypothetical protein
MRLRRKKKTDKNKKLPESQDTSKDCTTDDSANSAGLDQDNHQPSSNGSPQQENEKNVTINGEMKSNSLNSGCKTPPVERKPSKLAAFSRIFKPWKWKRRKKSEKIEKTAVDLERKISVRTSREELIKRGVLKELPEEQTQLPTHTETDEEPEAVQEDKVDTTQVQANGTPTTADSVHLHDTGGGGEPVSHVQTDSPSTDDHRLSHNNGIISTQADVTHVSQHSPPIVSSSQVRVSISEDQNRWSGSPQVDPRLRVMLPVTVGDQDRHLPVLQRQLPVPQDQDSHEEGDSTPRSPYQIYKAIPSPQPPLFEGPDLSTPPCSQAMPVHSTAGYTPSGLTFATPIPRSHMTQGVSMSTPTTSQERYEEVPAFEPDLSKKPKRSALKGAKKQEEQQMNLQAALHQQLQATLNRNKPVPPKIAPKPKVRLLPSSVKVVDPHNKENTPVHVNFEEPDYDNLHSDSDEDDEIHYSDREAALAAKIRRQDSLARFLSQRPHRRELIERNILPVKSDKERQDDKQYISGKLNRRLSLRPTQEELEAKNILHRQTLEEMRQEREEKKRTLVRKLSFRPTVDELKERKIIKFSDYVEVTDANEYDRRADKPWTRLTPRDKAAIRKELNEFKSSEMEVHEESRHLTRFHRP